MKLDTQLVEPIIALALEEDVQFGDITTDSCVSKKTKAKAKIIAKENGVVCGVQLIKIIFDLLSKKAIIKIHKNDGDIIKKGDLIVEIQANARILLMIERTLLNFMQQLSGVSTTSNLYANKIKKDHAKVLDTRKTMPGMRYLQKYAVKCGGAENHRRGLYDMILIKENHISIAGSITNAVSLARKKHTDVCIEVECSSMSEVKEALQSDCDWIMLDNLSIEKMKKAVEMINKKMVVEASGGITLSNIVSVAKTGVDFISCGAITHSYKALDLSMYIDFN